MPRPSIVVLRLISVAVVASALASCANVQEAVNKSLDQLQAAAAKPAAKAPTRDPRPSGTRSPIGTELDGLYKRHPITNNQNPETFPRTAITIKSASRGMLNVRLQGAQYDPGFCMVFSAVVWQSRTQSRTYDDISVCIDDLTKRAQNVAFADVSMWALGMHFPHVQTTGQLRTTGPVPPTHLTPTDPLSRRYFDQFLNSIFFTGGLLHIMGYNWQDRSDMRVWFVSVPQSE